MERALPQPLIVHFWWGVHPLAQLIGDSQGFMRNVKSYGRPVKAGTPYWSAMPHERQFCFAPIACDDLQGLPQFIRQSWPHKNRICSQLIRPVDVAGGARAIEDNSRQGSAVRIVRHPVQEFETVHPWHL